MDEAPHLRYEVSRGDYEAAAQHVTQRLMSSIRWHPGIHLLTAAMMLCLGTMTYCYLEISAGYSGGNPRLIVLGALAFFALIVFSVWQQKLRAAQATSAMVSDDGLVLGEQELEADVDALLHMGRGSRSRMEWRSLKSVEEFSGGLLLYLDATAFLVVPASAFQDPAERVRWLSVLRERSGTAPVAPMPPASTLSEEPRASVATDFKKARPGAIQSLMRNLRAGLRLSLFLRVERQALVATGEAFAVLMAVNLAMLFLAGFMAVGIRGQLSYYELPRALMAVPLILAFGLVAARATGERRTVLEMAVALMAISVTINFVMGMLGPALRNAEIGARYWQYFFFAGLGWWAVAIVAAVARLTSADLRRKAGTAVAGLALLLAPAWWLPQGALWVPVYDPAQEQALRPGPADEKGYYSQPEVLAGALGAIEPGRPGIPDLYLVAAGLYAREDVFMKEVVAIETLFRERFDADGRTLVLINNPGTLDVYPLASLTSLASGLRRVGEVMNPEEDVLVLYLSSHGSETHQLSVEFWPLRLAPIDPPALKKVLDESGIKWKVVVVSACYSGGFVEPLKNDFTAVITASSATRKSFGCGSASDATYLGKALFDQELRRTYSFEKAFDNARKSIAERERSQGFVPSEPQMYMGPALHAKLAEIERRLAAREASATGAKEGR